MRNTGIDPPEGLGLLLTFTTQDLEKALFQKRVVLAADGLQRGVTRELIETFDPPTNDRPERVLLVSLSSAVPQRARVTPVDNRVPR